MLEELTLALLDRHPLTRPLHFKVVERLAAQGRKRRPLFELMGIVTQIPEYAFFGAREGDAAARAVRAKKAGGIPEDELELHAQVLGESMKFFTFLLPLMDAGVIKVKGFRRLPNTRALFSSFSAFKKRPAYAKGDFTGMFTRGISRHDMVLNFNPGRMARLLALRKAAAARE